MSDHLDKIKPCPFCGQEPYLDYDLEYSVTIECVNRECPVVPSLGVDRDEGVNASEVAVRLWNTRA